MILRNIEIVGGGIGLRLLSGANIEVRGGLFEDNMTAVVNEDSRLRLIDIEIN